jgi:hypothetical protein
MGKDAIIGLREVDRKIAMLAASQEGVITSAQLNACGLGERGARHRVARGQLHRLFPGVYAVGHPVVTTDGRRIAAVLACGNGAVLSRRSAASAWGILNGDGRRFDVVAPGRSGGRVSDKATIDLRRTVVCPTRTSPSCGGFRSRRSAARSSTSPALAARDAFSGQCTKLR